ncbi:MAG TPA: hypothetical protein VJ835_06560 [Fimbriimonadaceae bacterium]|nr:hypothetical protein [Fimbriimonadaceae bacterium]
MAKNNHYVNGFLIQTRRNDEGEIVAKIDLQGKVMLGMLREGKMVPFTPHDQFEDSIEAPTPEQLLAMKHAAFLHSDD